MPCLHDQAVTKIVLFEDFRALLPRMATMHGTIVQVQKRIRCTRTEYKSRFTKRSFGMRVI